MTKSKTFIIYTALALLLFSLSSCCTKKKCFDAENLREIKLLNLSVEEGDSVLVEVFENNSNFTAKLDSSISVVTIGSEAELMSYYSVYLPENVQFNHDYRITILRYAEVYTLSQFEIDKEGCNSCFPIRPKNDFYNKLVSYFVNGTKVNKSALELKK